MTERKFKVGDRVRRQDGQTGTVVHTEFFATNPPQYWVCVRWESSGSKSYRLEDDLEFTE